MSTDKKNSSRPAMHPEGTPGKISEHKKSIDASSSKLKKANAKSSNKNIEKTGGKHDDWNDATGNSHISSSRK